MLFPNCFIEPDSGLEALANPNDALGIEIYSGHQARLRAPEFQGRNRIVDALAERLRAFTTPYEDQCSAQYYFDLVSTLRSFHGEFNRLVEVGVFMGGSSAVFGGLMDVFDYDLDLVDIDARFLRFAYERIRRTHPEAAKRVRLLHGDLPHYALQVMAEEAEAKCIVHHDGAHDFPQVVKDMASLSFVSDRILAIIAQDTHLRGTPEYMNFVDMALYAVFGTDLAYTPIGTHYEPHDERTQPNIYQGNYFMPGVPEGIVIPMAANSFHYPHPSMRPEAFL